MKQILLLGSLLFLSISVKAQTSYFRSKEIGSPVYRKITDLYLKMDQSIDTVTVEFKTKSGMVTKEKWISRFQGNESSDQKLLTLPINLERITCNLQITYAFAGSILRSENLDWGQCATPEPRQDDKYLADLTISEDCNV